MSKWITNFCWAFFFVLGSPSLLSSANITIIDSSGESTNLHVDESDRFDDVMQFVEQHFKKESECAEELTFQQDNWELQKELSLTFIVSNADITIRKKASGRNYNASVTKSEKKDIAYIVNTLAWDSLLSIANAKSSLKKAGERIADIHPLRFLITIFNDEELKAGVNAIKSRTSWIADEFFSNLAKSLSEESARQNMKPEFIQDFAQKVNINISLILPAIQAEKWADFVNILIDNIPRTNDPNRYNM
jgi:hypothetical protein